MYVRTYIHTYIPHAHTNTRTHIHTQAHMHTHTHAHAHRGYWNLLIAHIIYTHNSLLNVIIHCISIGYCTISRLYTALET